ncbi:aldo/keto reductase [Saccharopolyspora sp. 5N708]|uniref:aldo/keto reductase n=1 Tax=Saccharopolyspora sp. 5N708 TaxID=3457424 RepID=UPI003FD5576C
MPSFLRRSTRVDPAALTARDRAAAHAVRAVADELGVRPAQVAIAWTRSKSQAVLPIVGVSSVEQLAENLGAVELALPDDAIAKLEAAAEFQLGFPGDFIAECEPHPFAFGDAATRLDSHRPGASIR